MKESDLQKKIVAYLNENWKEKGVVFHHPMNNVRMGGIAKKKNMAARIGHDNKLLGVCKGIPDLVISVTKRDTDGKIWGSLWIELKSETGKVSTIQKKIHIKLRKSGHLVKVINNYEGAISAIETYLALKDCN
jgi:hypothetical protein